MFQQFIRFLIVAALLCLISVTLLEATEWLLQVTSPVIHGLLVSMIYLAGVYINFHLQRGWVFKATQNARSVSLMIYASWMIFCSGATGIVSGFILAGLQLQFPQLPLRASISFILALTIFSPVTFLGVWLIMKDSTYPAGPNEP